MALFKYRARDKQGAERHGVIEAASVQQAARLLRKQGYFVLLLQTKPRAKNPFGGFLRRITASDITDLTRQLSTMVDAGLPLAKSLQILANQAKNEQLRRLLEDILTAVESGKSLADALEKKSGYFSKTYVALIRSGEASGTLNDVLGRLADNLEKQRDFRNKVKGAMIYPVIVLVGMGIVMFVMMAFVIPKLTALYTTFEIELPLATRILINISSIFARFWWAILAVIVFGAAGFVQWKRTSQGKAIWDKIILDLPLFGQLQKEIALVETTRTLGILVGAGLPIIEALEIVADATANLVYKRGIEQGMRDAEKGYPLGASFSRNENFPPIFAEMVTIGEETGKLDETLQRLARFFETKSDQTVKSLTTAIEPLIMVILGIGVGFLVLAIITPIYNLTSAIK